MGVRFRFVLFLFTALLPATLLTAQPQERHIDPPGVDVLNSIGEELPNPFSGGLDLTRIGLFDDDLDGYPDLWTFNLGGEFRRYDNRGGFLYVRENDRWLAELPIRSWFRFADLDGDQLPDLFTSGERSEVLFLRNTGSAGLPSFAPPDTLRQTSGSTIYTDQLTVPTFVDIDADGDPDLFAGNVDGTITFYENVGSATQPELRFRTNRYEGLIVLSPAGTRKDDPATPTSLHGASVLDFVDLDDDGDPDILFGDFFTRGMLQFENRGSATVADFDTLWVDTAFAPDGDIVLSTGFNQAASGDVDRDQDIDVFVSSLLASARATPLELYENRGTPSEPLMIRSLTNPTGEIDIGRRAAPTFVRDGERQGLMIGSEDGSLTWMSLEESPEEGLRFTERRRFILEGLTSSIPAAGDLDGDGRAEIVVGKSDALDGTTLRLYRFDGEDLVRVPWQLDTTFNVVRSGAAPALTDLDGDGDLDLFVGGRNGRFSLFENTGTPTAPIFEVRTPPSPFDTLDLDANATPTFTDLDGDGDPDALIGSRDNAITGDLDSIRIWINDGGIFHEDPARPPRVAGQYPVPLQFTINTRTILLIGNGPGGLLWYADAPSSVDVESRGEEYSVHYHEGRTVFTFNGGANRGDQLDIYDVRGVRIMSIPLRSGERSVEIGPDGLAPGRYLWRIGEWRGMIHR